MHFDQFLRSFAGHPAVQLVAQYRYCRAGGPGSHQLVGNLPAEGPAVASHLQQDQSRGHADSNAGFSHPKRCPCRKWKNWPKTRFLPQATPSSRVVLGEHQRRTASGGPHSGGTPTALLASGLNRRYAHPALANRQRQPGEGKFRWSFARRGPSSLILTNSSAGADYKPHHPSAYGKNAPVRLSRTSPTVVDSAENVKQAAWVNSTPAVLSQHPASARH